MEVTPNEVTDQDSVTEGCAWPESEEAVASWVSDRQSKAESRLSDWYESAREAFQFTENKQWKEADAAKMESEKRIPVTFNRVAPIINSVCGQEVSNRQEVRFLPRRVGEVSAADPMNDAVRWIRDNCNAEDEDSDAFRDMTICGMGWTVTRMDYEENPDGEGKVERRDPLLMRWDPAARRKNLADKKWVQSDYWMTKEAIKERWAEADISGLTSLNKPTEGQQPHDATEAWKYKNDASGRDTYNDQWRVVHHVERFTKTIHRVVDPFTQQIRTLEADQYKLIKAKAEEDGVQLECTSIQQRVYWEAWVVGSVVLQSGVAKIQKDFQYQAMTCFRERETGFWFGLVLLMLDPQRYANRMASLLMSILATGAKGGMMYETGAFVNPAKAKKDWARWDSAIELTEGALAAGKVQAKAPVQLPQGAAELMQFAITSIRDVTGANVEMLGNRQEDQPGVVEEMRTKAGLTILAPVFDAIRLYRKRQGIVLAEFVTKFLSDGRLIRIWGPQGQQFIPLVRQPDVVEYDVVVDESPASRDVKEKTWRVLGPLIPGLHQMGVDIPPEVVDYLPIPESLAMQIKKALMRKMSQPPQPPLEIMKEQMKGQVQQAIAQQKAQLDHQAAQDKAQMDMMIAQAKAQAQEQIELARTQADIRISQAEAQLKAETERMRDGYQLQLEQQKAAQEQETELRKTAMQIAGQIETARLNSAAKGVEAPDAATTGNDTQIMERILETQQQLLQTIGAPRQYVRDPQTQRITHSMPVNG